jgi:ZIP family zinc transporter
MLIDSMIPEARKGAGRVAGLATTLGLAVAAALSSLSWPGSNRWIRA